MAHKFDEPSLLVFSDDWGRHPSSCQHLIGHLLDRYRVQWVNTIGTRRPRPDMATLKRGFEKICQWSRSKESGARIPDNLEVIRPKMWPWFTSKTDRNLNRELLYRQLAPSLRANEAPVIALTTIPIVADLVGLLPVDRWVYYCVDDFTQWPGLDLHAMLEMEEALIQKVDQVIAVSQTLQDKMSERGRNAPLLTHGVDLDFWAEPVDSSLEQLNHLERPLIVFWGVVDQRMDVSIIQQLSADLTKGTIVLVGPENDPDPALSNLGRVVRLSPLPFSELPVLGQEASVMIMPYADLPVTRAMQPLKLKEYLATGKPVVMSDLPANRDWHDAADLANNPVAFSRAVQTRLQTGLPEAQRVARKRLIRESWQAKANLLETWALGREESYATVG